MSKSRQSANRQEANATAHWPPLAVWGAVTLLYLVIYFQQPVRELPGDDSGQPMARSAWLVNLLFPGELVGRWMGTEGRWSLLDRMPVLIAGAFIVIFGWAVGHLLLRWLLPPTEGDEPSIQLTRLERFVFAQAVGLNAVSLYVLLLGLCGWMSRWLFLIPAAPAIVLACMTIWKRRDPDDQTASKDNGPFGKRWLWAAVPFGLAVLLMSMLPPVDFDVREYHLQAPREFYEEGQIGFLSHNVYANMSLGAEMHALLGMALLQHTWFGALAGKLVIGWFAILTAMALFAAGKRLQSRAAGIMAAIVFLSIPAVIRDASAGLVEVVWGCYLLLAWYAFVLWQQSQDVGDGQTAARSTRSYLLLTGLLAGSALACKYPALVFVVAPLLVWVGLETWQRCESSGSARWSSVWRSCGLYLATVAVACAPWFAKNWIATGNPVYPLAYEVFGGETRTPEKAAQWNAAHSPPNFNPEDMADRLWRLAGASDWQTPVLVPLLLAVVVSGSLRRRFWPLLAFLLWYLACWWLLTHRIDRFWLPLLPLAALAAGIGACWRRELVWKWSVGVLLGVGLASNLFFATLGGAGSDPRMFAPLDDLYTDQDRVDDWHLHLNQLAGSDIKVMLVGEAEVFDLQCDFQYATVFDDCPFEQIAAGKNPVELLHDLRLEGITHIFVHWGEIERYRSPGNYGFTDFVTREKFAELVDERVLFPPQTIDDHPGELYTVR